MLVNGEMNFLISFFVSHCTPLSSTSILPPPTIRTDKRVSSLKINEDDILFIIKSLNSNHMIWDKPSIKLIKIYDKTVVYPLKLVFKDSFQEVFFSVLLEKTNVPIHIKRK